MPYYRISGLSVESDLALPGVQSVAQSDSIDARIILGDVPECLESPQSQGPTWAIDHETFLLKVPGVARFLVKAGRELVMQTAPGVSHSDAVAFLLSSALCALLYQRRNLVLHAGAVAYQGQAFLFCGESGAGKSSLVAALTTHGCQFLNDDLCAIRLNTANRPIVAPDGRSLKLWRQTITQLCPDAPLDVAVRSRLNKFHITPPGGFADAAETPVRAVYLLKRASSQNPPGIIPLSLPDSAQGLSSQAYRQRLVNAMKLQGDHFKMITTLLQHARVFYLTPYDGLGEIGKTISLLKSHWHEIA